MSKEPIIERIPELREFLKRPLDAYSAHKLLYLCAQALDVIEKLQAQLESRTCKMIIPGCQALACSEVVAEAFEKLKAENANLQFEGKVLKLALNDIRNWDDDLEAQWDDPGTRAAAALEGVQKP